MAEEAAVLPIVVKVQSETMQSPSVQESMAAGPNHVWEGSQTIGGMGPRENGRSSA